MDRQDVQITKTTITIHPEKLAAMKQQKREEISRAGAQELFDMTLDEELDHFVEQLVADELAEEFAIQIREKLTAGYKK